MKRAVCGYGVAASLLLSCSTGWAAGPDLEAGALYHYLPEGRSSYLKRIDNVGEVAAFTTLQLAEMHFDAAGNVTEVPINQADYAQRALVATPPRMVVPAQGQHSVRVIFRGERDHERYFRVRFVPVLPKAGDAFVMEDGEKTQYSESLSAGVSVLKAIGTVLVVRPVNTRYATALNATGNTVEVRNDGNATVLVDNVRSCLQSQCSAPQKLHVRPGQRSTLPAAETGELFFDVVEGPRKRRFSYVPGSNVLSEPGAA